MDHQNLKKRSFAPIFRALTAAFLATWLAVPAIALPHREDLPKPIKPTQNLNAGIGDGVVTLSRPVTNEVETFRYRNEDDSLNTQVFESISRFFRCRLTHEQHPIDPKLIELLDNIEDHFGAGSVTLVSAYRSPTRNALMRRQGRRVAKESLHMRGMAADIKIAGVPSSAIRDYAYSLKQGGIGFYGKKAFVHIDTGELRAWGFRPGGGKNMKASVGKASVRK